MKKLLLTALVVIALAVVALAQGGAATPGTPQRGERGTGAARGGGPGAQAPAATGPIADMANAGVEAINKNDAAYFENHLAADAVWFDEDGHAIAGKDRILAFLK